MIEPFSIHCPECNVRLKIKNPKAVGKKIKCPKCTHPFLVEAPPSDDLDDFDAFDDPDLDGLDDDDGFGDEEAPAAKPRAGGKKKGKKKSDSGSKGMLAAIIAGCVLLVAGIGGGVYWFVIRDDGAADKTAGADEPDTDMPDSYGMAPGGGGPGGPGGGGGPGGPGGPGSPSGPGGPGGPGGPSGPGGGVPVAGGPGGAAQPGFGGSTFPGTGPGTQQPGTQQPGTTPAAPSGPHSIDLAYLPADAEILASLDINRIWNAPTTQLALASPQVAGQVKMMQDMVGFSPADVNTIVVGMGGISDAIAAGREPDPNSLSLIAVMRMKTAIDIGRLQQVEPRLQQQKAPGGQTYLKLDEKPPAAIWVAEPTTIVAGFENSVLAAMQSGSSTVSRSDLDFAVKDTELLVAIVPAQAESLLAMVATQVPPSGVPAVDNFAQAFLQNAKAISLGLDLTTKLGIKLAVKSGKAGGGQKMAAAFTDLVATGRQMLTAFGGDAPPQAAGMIKIGDQFLQSVQVSSESDVFQVQGALDNQQAAVVAAALLLPAIQSARDAALRTQGGNNMKQIGLAMHNLHDSERKFPDLAVRNAQGQPLLSWRVRLLSYLGQEDLYRQFKLDEPWNSQHNQQLIAAMPDTFRSPLGPNDKPGTTRYLAVMGPKAVFENGQGVSFSQITDGSSNTIMLVEADIAVPWTQPSDYQYSAQNPTYLLGGTGGGFNALFCDGRMEFISSSIDPQTLIALFTRNGGEQVNLPRRNNRTQPQPANSNPGF